MTKERYVIGVDLGGTNIKAALVASAGNIVTRNEVRTNADKGYASVVDTLARLVNSVMSDDGPSPLVIGIGSAGAIDHRNGIITSSPNLPGWTDVPLAGDLEKAVGIPVVVENDGAAAALGEGWKGAASEWSDFVAITLGTGVGGGIILGGNIWRGSTGSAGEVGHIVVKTGGRHCGCGSRGCVERYASATGVKISVQERLESAPYWLQTKIKENGGRISGRFITEGARTGDSFCVKVYELAGTHLGLALANIALLLDVTKFVIGGGVSNALPVMEPKARESALGAAFTLTDEKLVIVKAGLGENAGLLGAAKLALSSKTD